MEKRAILDVAPAVLHERIPESRAAQGARRWCEVKVGPARTKEHHQPTVMSVGWCRTIDCAVLWWMS